MIPEDRNQLEKREAHELTTEQELRQKLRKIAALFEGATTAGERDAAAAAIDRVRAALGAAERTEKTIEMNFRLPDRWNRRLLPLPAPEVLNGRAASAGFVHQQDVVAGISSDQKRLG